jgi:DNA polymerase III sliding clamp (beta) subunit (PCNA family)
MPLFLPAALAPLVRSAANDAGRYSMNGVEIREQGNNTFCCTVTDGRQLIVARGACPQPGMLSGMSDACVTVPAEAWMELFRKAPRNLGIFRPKDKGPEPVSIELLASDRLLLTCQGRRWFESHCLDGRFPDWTTVIPKEKPRFTVRVNPEMLAGLLTNVSRMLDAESQSVTIAFWTPDRPIAVVAKDRVTGLCIDSLLMPITVYTPPTKQLPPPADEEPPPDEEA